MSLQLTRPITDSTRKGKQARVPHWMRTNTNTSTDRHYHHSPRPGENSYPILRGNVDCVKEPLVETLKKSSQGPGNEESELYSPRFHFLGEGPSNNPLNSGKHNPGIGKEAAGESDTSCFKDFNKSLLSRRDWFQKMHGVRLLQTPSQTLDSKEEELNDDIKSWFDLETMRICTTVDSVRRSCPRFSQTTHSVLITKKTENDVFIATRLVKKSDENMFFGQGKNKGLKLPSLSSSSNGEEMNNVGNFEGKVITIRNDSSAETDTMEMDFLKEKAFNMNSNSPLPNVSTYAREVERQWTKTELPDINIELTTLPAVKSPPLCLSSPRTQSLEMALLLANADHTKTTIPVTNSVDLDPSNRWVKRLKPSSSKFSTQDTMISNPNARKSQDKTKNYFSSILDCNITRPSSSKKHHCGQDTILSDTNEESLLSNAWIKRWLRNGAKNPDWTVGKVGVLSDLKASVDIDDDDDDLKKEAVPEHWCYGHDGESWQDFSHVRFRREGLLLFGTLRGLSEKNN